MKIYFDPLYYRKESRNFIADILRPYINDRSREENIEIYGEQMTRYQIVADPAQADLHVLTMTWDYYFKTGQLKEAESFIERAQSIDRPVAIWQNGDFSVRLHGLKNVFLFQCGGYSSTRAGGQFSKPVFVGDPLQELNIPEPVLRSKNLHPTVGFCGQAEYTFSHAAQAWLRFGFLNMKSILGLTPYELIPLVPLSTQIRSKTLGRLEANPNIRTNFIKRKKYRAGAQTSDEISISRGEFWKNMLESDYVVCVRGGGNFSARLYETLAMGRIPIFVDTDCILPYEKNIHWKELCVWVDVTELDLLPRKVLDFHERLTEDDFVRHQKRCRKLWEDRLSFSGFFKHFPEYFLAAQ